MTFFLIVGFLFLAGAIFNIFDKNYQELAGCTVLSLAMFGIYFSRRKKEVADIQAFSSQQPQRCCKCGRTQNVRMRAYMLCYSIILFTSKSPGSFKPVCDACRVSAGLPYSLGTLILGWWGFPWGPIYTIQCLIKNFRGGEVIEQEKSEPDSADETVSCPYCNGNIQAASLSAGEKLCPHCRRSFEVE